jgi:flagellar hook assembly protein FlgD
MLFDKLTLPEAGYFLEQNYPNPYDAKTNIRFILPQTEEVKLSVYDQYGKEVKVLIEGELSAGEHTAIFDGSKLPSGVYHYSLQAGEYRASRKMVKF